MDIREFKNKLFEKAKSEGFTECEIYCGNSKSFNVNVYKGSLEKYSNSSTGGFNFRGLYNGSMGYSYSEKIDESVIDEIVKDAKQNAEIISSPDKEFIYAGDEKYSEISLYNEDLNKITYNDILKLALKMEKAAYAHDSRITGVNRSMIVIGEGEAYIANTKGLELSTKDNHLLAYCEVMAEDNGNVKENGELVICKRLEDFSPEKTGLTAAKKVIEHLNAKSMEGGKIKAVIQNETMADVMDCFISNFYAENAQKGFSLLKDRVNEKIAADIITIADEPLLKDGLNSTPFDSEGVATHNKNVVENGVLKTLLYNLKSANKDGVKSTGNGFRNSFKGTITTSATNFYIKNGSVNFDELISDIDKGVLITDVQGLHSGANAITGDFSLAAEGFLIENGKVTTPVEQITIAGNFYDILKSVIQISNDLKFNSSGVGSPSVKLTDIAISGL